MLSSNLKLFILPHADSLRTINSVAHGPVRDGRNRRVAVRGEAGVNETTVDITHRKREKKSEAWLRYSGVEVFASLELCKNS